MVCVGMQSNYTQSNSNRLRPRAYSHSTPSSSHINDFKKDTPSICPVNNSPPSATRKSDHQSSAFKQYLLKTRQAASYLRQIRHTQSCLGICGSPICNTTLIVLNHINCCIDHSCTFSGCNTTKALLNHSFECKRNRLNQDSNSSHHCLLCIIADIDHGQQINSALHNIHYDHYDYTLWDNDETLKPRICDEMIENNRIPFQDITKKKSNSHDLSSLSKNENILNDKDSNSQHNNSERKIRSKSISEIF